VKHRDLNQSPARTMKDLVSSLRAQAGQSATGAHGVKHMGASGDSRWTRPDGTVHSVRELDATMEHTREELAEAIANLEELNNVTLPELWDKLDQLEDLDDVQEILDELDKLGSEVKEAGRLYTAGPPPSDPVVGRTLWVAPNGRVFRAVDC